MIASLGLRTQRNPTQAIDTRDTIPFSHSRFMSRQHNTGYMVCVSPKIGTDDERITIAPFRARHKSIRNRIALKAFAFLQKDQFCAKPTEAIRKKADSDKIVHNERL